MHLPPLESSIAQECSEILAYRPPTPPTTPQPPSLHKSVDTILPSHLGASAMEALPHHLHRLLALHLSNDTRLILKISPDPRTLLLRHERQLLANEAATLIYLSRLPTTLRVPQLLKYNPFSQNNLRAPFIVTSRLSGVPLVDVAPDLSPSERTAIISQVHTFHQLLQKHTSSNGTFGPAGLVASKSGGYCTWKEAFGAMLEEAMQDGEDYMVNISYWEIREALSRWEGFLDGVEEARLVVLGLEADEGHVLIDPATHEVCGLCDFGQSIWGDVAFGERYDGKTDIKSLLYACYHAVVAIVKSHYRADNNAAELEARKTLTKALALLSGQS